MTTDRVYAATLERVLGNPEALRSHAAALTRIAEFLDTDPSIHAFLERSDVAIADRIGALRTAFGSRVPDTAYAFLALLASRHALRALGAIASACTRRAEIASGTAQVVITSARALSREARTDIEHAVATATGRAIRASYIEDPALIAGIRVTVDGSHRWDSSVAGKLSQIVERLRFADTT